MRTISRCVTSILMVLTACPPTGTSPPLPKPVDQTNHPYFPIGVGTLHEFNKALGVDGTMTCDSCHVSTADSFSEFQCINCHKHPVPLTDRLHASVADYVSTSAGCYQCHATGERQTFSHTGITDHCAECHQPEAAFAALPKPNFTHPQVGTTDCGGCHVVTSWKGAGVAPSGVFDPARALSIESLVPTFVGTTISKVTPSPQRLPMPMNHATSTLDAGVATTCIICHEGADTGAYFPGVLHSSLANSGLPQPTACAECHTPTKPAGFVGPLTSAPSRTPPTGPMRHEAVVWNQGAPSTIAIVPGECALCHQTPDDILASTWSTGRADAGIHFHSSLAAASRAQPSSCLDCHANSRPLTLLTAANAALPAGISFEHDADLALDDCGGCHNQTERWSGGRFHLAGNTAPSTCLPCHSQQRPTSTATWASTTYTRSPFDYVTNASGIEHGGGEDCAVCHTGSGTGTWGSSQNWQGGHFPHGTGTLATTTCAVCHLTQRPAAVVQGFDHTGTGDCKACHQSTVTAGRYIDYFNPLTQTLPGGDWKEGRTYPGDSLVTSTTQFIALTQYTLQRNNTSNLITGITTQNSTFFNAMLHTSTAIPPQVSPGPVNTPDTTSCWHCHTHTNGTVSTYINGKFHSALAAYSATPGGPVSPLPQPTAKCQECHEAMRPNVIVQKAASVLQPMDHSASFTASVVIGGKPTTSVSTIDCSVCHTTVPGTNWGDGRFHVNIGAAVPQDCVGCHYPLMATAQADVTTGTTFTMKHRSTQLKLQKCDTCHSTALAQSKTLPLAALQWKTGALHAHAAPQPTSCAECHASSDPAGATQSTVTYPLTQGNTSSNTAMWMNHTISAVTSRDCSTCHAADAKTANSVWNRGTAFHSVVASPGACAVCHGTGNGRGTVIGTNNNIPLGATNSHTTTTASTSPGVKDQINHADINVISRDCSTCHTQQGSSTTPGIQGQEWKQANFHKNFNASNPLVMNTTTGRCSTCHLNLKPGASFAAFNHSSFTAVSGTPDCSSCHSWPGTNTSTPNWLGAAAMPAFIAVGGFTIPSPPATGSGTLQTGISNLPHPTVAAGVVCTTCHTAVSGGRKATGYDHKSTLINSNCKACHESGSDLVAVSWNSTTHGDTRPAIAVLVKGKNCSPIHFYPTDCKECHRVPTANGTWTSGATALSRWNFSHSKGSPMTTPATCNKCHSSSPVGCGIPN